MAVSRSLLNEMPVGRAAVRFMEARRVMRRAENCMVRGRWIWKPPRQEEALGIQVLRPWVAPFFRCHETPTLYVAKSAMAKAPELLWAHSPNATTSFCSLYTRRMISMSFLAWYHLFVSWQSPKRHIERFSILRALRTKSQLVHSPSPS